MLINCPRCGFSQPQDRYCANCGVDIENFQPKETPWYQRVLLSPILHVALIFILVLASVLFIRQRERQELYNRVEYLRGGPVIVERRTDVAGLPSTTMPAMPSTTLVGGDIASKTTSSLTDNRATLTSTTSTTSARASNNSPTLKAYYVEIDQSSLNSFIEDSRSTGQFNRFDEAFWGAVPDIEKKLSKAAHLQILHKIEKSFDSSHNSQQWFLGLRAAESENNIGLMTYVALAEPTRDGIIRGEVEVQRSFREGSNPTGNITKKSFPAAFELGPRMGFMMSGVLPRKIALENEDEFEADGLLKIFKSATFRSGKSEFTLFLEFDTPPATTDKNQ